MAYFAPYIDGTGIHMPTYEDRLGYLCENYRAIFGVTEEELTPYTPDYQLLSVFAKALDDVSGLVLQAYHSRNPMLATGASLDLLLPQYGLVRGTGETDASVRNRIRTALAARNYNSADTLIAGVYAVPNVKEVKAYINDTDSTDSMGNPGHSVNLVVRGGNRNAIAQAIFHKKAPGIGTAGSTAVNVTDAYGNVIPIRFTRYSDKIVFVYIFIRPLAGADQAAISGAVVPAVLEFIDNLGIAAALNIPQLYGIIYAANPEIANTFIVTDIQVAAMGASAVARDKIDCGWNEKITAVEDGGVTVNYAE